MTQECCICYNEIEKKMMIELNCHHSFCENCIINIQKEDKPKCPLCREMISYGSCDDLLKMIDDNYKYLVVYVKAGIVSYSVTMVNLKNKIIYTVEVKNNEKITVESVNFDDCCKNYNVKHPLIFYKNKYTEVKGDNKKLVIMTLCELVE